MRASTTTPTVELDPLFGSASWTGTPEWDTLHGAGAGTRELRRHALAAPGGWDPDVAVYRRGDTMIIRAELAGVVRERVKVEVEDDVLMIVGEQVEAPAPESPDHHRSERNHGSFYRAIPLPDGTDTEHCEATFSDGVLEIQLNLPTGEVHRRRSIEIH